MATVTVKKARKNPRKNPCGTRRNPGLKNRNVDPALMSLLRKLTEEYKATKSGTQLVTWPIYNPFIDVIDIDAGSHKHSQALVEFLRHRGIDARPELMDSYMDSGRIVRYLVRVNNAHTNPRRNPAFDEIKAVYTEELGRAMDRHPEQYFYPKSNIPVVVDRMMTALQRGSAHLDTPAIKAMCKRFNVKPTRSGIASLFSTVSNPRRNPVRFPSPSTYRLFYMDNNRRKRVVRGGLSYAQAWKEAGRYSRIYGTAVEYEPENGSCRNPVRRNTPNVVYADRAGGPGFCEKEFVKGTGYVNKRKYLESMRREYSYLGKIDGHMEGEYFIVDSNAAFTKGGMHYPKNYLKGMKYRLPGR